MNDEHAADTSGEAAREPSGDSEELFESLLELYDEASAHGETPRHIDDTRLPKPLREELASLGQCVTLLNTAARHGWLAAFDRTADKGWRREAGGSDTSTSADPGSTRASPALESGSETTDADDSLHGERIGRFEIIRELGRGGYGVVFLARDPTIGREVALKLPRPEALVIPELRGRFLREAQAAGRLDHPHVMPIHEVGEDGALCYLVSPYCRGPSLARWLNERRGDVAARDAAQLVAALAEGLDHAHRLGVLHRDIKPGNVLLDVSATEQPTREIDRVARPLSSFVPKLTDFGLAKQLKAADNDTRTGALLGTPVYMAPEQAMGRSDQIVPGTDVYAMGGLLYELLTGRPPLVGENDAETLRLIATTPPVHPRHIRKGLPRDLEAITLKCLEKSPTDRYRSAAELAADLRRFLAGEPTLARRSGPARRMWKCARRRPAIAGLLIVVGILLTSLAVGNHWYSRRLGRETAEVLQRQYMRDIGAAFKARENGAIDQAEALLAKYNDGTPGANVRNFEWHWLRNSLHEEKFVIPSHHGEAYTVVFSLDSKLLLSGGKDGVIRSWDCQTGFPVFELRGHTSCVNQLAISPDGRSLASASCDRTVRLWDLESRREIRILGEHVAPLSCLAFARLTPILAAGTHDGRVCIWNTGDGSLITTLIAGEPVHQVDTVAFGCDDDILAATIGMSFCSAWSTDGWAELKRHAFSAQTLAFVGHHERLVVASRSREIIQWDIAAEGQQRSVGRLSSEIQALASMHTAEIVFAAGYSGSIQAIGMDGPCNRIFSGSTSRVQSLAVSADDHYLASASFDGLLRVWDLNVSEFSSPVETTASPYWAEVSANGEWLATRATDQRLRLWSMRNGKLAAEREDDQALLFSASGNYALAVHNRTESFQLLRPPTWKPVKISQEQFDVRAADISGDDRVLAVMDANCSAQIFDVATGELRCRVTLPAKKKSEYVRIALSQDGSRLVWFEGGKLGVHAVDTHTGSQIPLPSDKGFLANVRMYPGGYWLSPDGRSVVVAVDDNGTFVIRDVLTGADLCRRIHAHGSHNLAWSPDGERLAIVTQLQTIAIIDSHSGEPVAELDGGLEPVISNLVFSANGDSLLAFTGGGGLSPGRWRQWRVTRK